MKRTFLIGIALVVLLSVAGGAALVALDDGEVVTDSESGADGDDGSSGDDGDGSDGDDSDSVTTATPNMEETESTFTFGIDAIEECGTTCRDVTVTLQNDGAETAENVVVETRIYTDGDLIWDGDETVGTLESNDSHTSTRRVELSYSDAMKVEGNDGWITIETIIEFEDGTEVFTDERQVT